MNSRSNTERQNFSNLLLTLEHDMGTRDACYAFLDCLQATLPITAFKDADDLKKQITDFYGIFIHLKPRMAIIQNYLDAVMRTMLAYRGTNPKKLIEQITETVRAAEEDNRTRCTQLVKEAVKLIHNDDRVLIHSHSHTVLDVLKAARNTHKRFSVIVAEQEAEKTLDVIGFLKEHGIPFTVVPEYMLSHVEHDISCMLLGAVTLKHDMNFAVDAGSKAIVSEMNSAKVPVYLLLTTNKFSYWRTREAHQVVQTTKSAHHKRGGFEYERVKFSHDRLPADQVTKVITEEGAFAVPDLKKRYAEKLDEYRAQTAAFANPDVDSGKHY